MMVKNYNESVEMDSNPNLLFILNHPYKILITAVSGPRKTNVLLSLIKHQRPDVDKICLHVKDPFESK